MRAKSAILKKEMILNCREQYKAISDLKKTDYQSEIFNHLDVMNYNPEKKLFNILNFNTLSHLENTNVKDENPKYHRTSLSLSAPKPSIFYSKMLVPISTSYSDLKSALNMNSMIFQNYIPKYIENTEKELFKFFYTQGLNNENTEHVFFKKIKDAFSTPELKEILTTSINTIQFLLNEDERLHFRVLEAIKTSLYIKVSENQESQLTKADISAFVDKVVTASRYQHSFFYSPERTNSIKKLFSYFELNPKNKNISSYAFKLNKTEAVHFSYIDNLLTHKIVKGKRKGISGFFYNIYNKIYNFIAKFKA